MENQAGIENSALLIDAAMRARLAALYSAPGRHYHGLAHAEALLALAERHRAAIADFAALEAAIWFHDAIYDSRRQDNEARSAALAREWLAGRAEPERLDRIAAMIEATRTHRLPDGEDTAARGDAALLLDMDLSILAAPQAAFDAYERAVRLEYGWGTTTGGGPVERPCSRASCLGRASFTATRSLPNARPRRGAT